LDLISGCDLFRLHFWVKILMFVIFPKSRICDS